MNISIAPADTADSATMGQQAGDGVCEQTSGNQPANSPRTATRRGRRGRDGVISRGFPDHTARR